MATKKQYALWCLQLVNGNDIIADEVMDALADDGYISGDDEDELDVFYDMEEE
jgi:hypothetical protein